MAPQTENPSFEVNAALLSRSKVYTLRGLTEAEIVTILDRALHDRERGLGNEPIAVDEGALAAIARYSNGDAQVALNLLELTTAAAPAEGWIHQAPRPADCAAVNSAASVALRQERRRALQHHLGAS